MDKLPVDLSQHGKVLFWGIGGSRAYGLADQGSDLDYRGVYIAPTMGLFKFKKPPEEFVQSEPNDVALDEIEKYLKLLCKGNHNSISDLFIEPQYIGHTKIYLELQRVAPHLVPKRGYFECVKGLASKARHEVEEAHLSLVGIAPEKLAKLNKKAMHAARVIDTAIRFMTTKQMVPRVAEDQRDLLLSIKYGDLNPSQVLRVLDVKLRALATADSISQLRASPNIEKAEELLGRIRRNHEFYK